MTIAAPKRILVVSYDRAHAASRTALLQKAGYMVASVESACQAMRLLESTQFDLILLARKSLQPPIEIDRRLHEKYPHLLTLKIDAELNVSSFPAGITDSMPHAVVEALRGVTAV